MQEISLNLDVGGMKPIVQAFNNIDYNQNFKIVIHHKPNTRIRVEKYPLLCSIVNEIRQLGYCCKIELKCNQKCSQLNYAERMGFLTFLGLDYTYPLIKRNGGGRFIEVKNITNYYYPETEMLEVFTNDFNFTKEQADDVAMIFSELTNNSYMHAENKGGSILYCQKYPIQKNLKLFIVDSGIGICNAMKTKEKYQNLNELEVFKKSIEFGEGNGKGYGQGLYLVTEFIKRNLGYLRLISGKYYLKVEKGLMTFHELDLEYKGVILELGIPFVINTTMLDLMDEKTE